MKFYVSFGQVHSHSINGVTFDKDCLLELKADDHNQAHKQAFKMFDAKFCFVYSKQPDMQFFPRGVIKLEQETKT